MEVCIFLDRDGDYWVHRLLYKTLLWTLLVRVVNKRNTILQRPTSIVYLLSWLLSFNHTVCVYIVELPNMFNDNKYLLICGPFYFYYYAINCWCTEFFFLDKWMFEEKNVWSPKYVHSLYCIICSQKHKCFVPSLFSIGFVYNPEVNKYFVPVLNLV